MNNIKKFGGKGASLLWLSENENIGYKVPEFEILDTSYHEDHLKQPKLAQISAQLQSIVNPKLNLRGTYQKITPRLRKKLEGLVDRFKGREGVAVRSSAVSSEDSEKVSGAGIYDTVHLHDRHFDLESLEDAVLQVFGSVESETARNYRQQAGVEDERMAVVVQELSNDVNYFNGVMQSRLQAVKKIVPISWSGSLGGVVSGDENATVSTTYFKQLGNGKTPVDYRAHFFTDDLREHDAKEVQKTLFPILLELKKKIW